MFKDYVCDKNEYLHIELDSTVNVSQIISVKSPRLVSKKKTIVKYFNRRRMDDP
jgi:hypothetical protein